MNDEFTSHSVVYISLGVVPISFTVILIIRGGEIILLNVQKGDKNIQEWALGFYTFLL